MRIAQVLSFLPLLVVTAWGFATNFQPQTNSRGRLTPNVFLKEGNSPDFAQSIEFEEPNGVTAAVKQRKKRVAKTKTTTSQFVVDVSTADQPQRRGHAIQEPVPKPTSLSADNEQSWNTYFQQLVAYKEQNGDCMVPKRFRKNQPLASWVGRQRRDYKSQRKAISDERIRMLTDIGFDWNVVPTPWEVRFQELLDYKQQHGNCLIPHAYHENPSLGNWVHQQRTRCKNWRTPTKLYEDRIQQLKTIGFVFDGRVAKWEMQFRQLVEYKEQHGNCLVPESFPENPSLGTWVVKQRHLYSCEPKRISDERIQKLNSIYFEWNAQKSNWDFFFQQLVNYKEKYGNCLVRRSFSDIPKLARWVGTQRAHYNGKRLSQERIDRLNSIGFEWSARKAR